MNLDDETPEPDHFFARLAAFTLAFIGALILAAVLYSPGPPRP